ncbi:WD repeat-containing protein 26, partial [Blomia tropicalis]
MDYVKTEDKAIQNKGVVEDFLHFDVQGDTNTDLQNHSLQNKKISLNLKIIGFHKQFLTILKIHSGSGGASSPPPRKRLRLSPHHHQLHHVYHRQPNTVTSNIESVFESDQQQQQQQTQQPRPSSSYLDSEIPSSSSSVSRIVTRSSLINASSSVASTSSMSVASHSLSNSSIENNNGSSHNKQSTTFISTTMHSYGDGMTATNGSNDETNDSLTDEFEIFTNATDRNRTTIGPINVFGRGGGGEISGNMGNASGNTTNGVIMSNNGNYTNGNSKEDDDDEVENFPYMNGNSHGAPKKFSPYVIKSQTDRDIIRLIGQQLRIMGLDRTVEHLIQESGCRLDHPTAAKFRSHVMNGEWNKADVSLQELKLFLENPKHLIKMKFLLLEQKYLECIEDGRNQEALECLRSEITPLNYKKEKLPKICRYIFTNSLEELKKVAKWEGKGQASRLKLMEKLQNFLPPSIMLPPRRLQCLLNQAIELQKDHCPYHNYRIENSMDEFSLLVDHACSKDDLPSETTQILAEHRDEVWYCKFSNNGSRLASGSKDGAIVIWDIDPETFHLTLTYNLLGHPFAISFFAWSPDDHYLVALGPEESGEFWIWDTHTGTIKHKGINQNDDSLTTCAWHKDSKKFVAGGTRGHFYIIDLNGTIVENWEGVRVQSLAYKNDGKTVLAADTHFRIRGYNFEDVTDYNIIREDHSIMSFVCDDSGRYALLNVENQGVHLWDLEDRVLVRKFQGITQGYYTIHSCFGGVEQVFIASGSEDNKIYIWHTKREHPISVLKGHSRTVNCVSWNPRYPNMLASASDDTTVRIWCSKRRPIRPDNQQSTSVTSNSVPSMSGPNSPNAAVSNVITTNSAITTANPVTLPPPPPSGGSSSNSSSTSLSASPINQEFIVTPIRHMGSNT